MADTKRSLSALITAFADNTTEAIDEQDLRDLIVSAYGSRMISSAVVTTSGDLDTDDDVVLADASGGSVTLTLPALVSGKIFTIKCVDATNTVILAAAGSDTIDGAATKTLTTLYAAITIIGGPAEWHVLSSMGTIS